MRISELYNLNRNQDSLDFLDIPLDTDLLVFVDPLAIKSLKNSLGNESTYLLQSYFSEVLTSIKNGNHGRAKELLAFLSEKNEFHLGYSKGKSQGKGMASGTASRIWKSLTGSKAAKSGLLKDLEDTALMIHGIGPDMVSDAVCNIIREPLIKYTQEMCNYYGIPMKSQVESGPIWNPDKKIWQTKYVKLPCHHEFGKIILIPKILVRHQLSVSHDHYYKHYLIPYVQAEEARAGSSLAVTLKGKKHVYKKALYKKYGANKDASVLLTADRQDVLDSYKKNAQKNVKPPLTDFELSDSESMAPEHIRQLLDDVKNTPLGKNSSHLYEERIEKLLSALFSGFLFYPRRESKIHEGRKRIDIDYTNEAKSGFFYWLSLHYAAPMIFVECKNYEKKVSNPELDQLSGRFSPSRGIVGLLVHRESDNKEELSKRCKDTASDSRGFIITIDDQELGDLAEEYINENGRPKFELLRIKFNKLIS